jgi:hypothetical protein
MYGLTKHCERDFHGMEHQRAGLCFLVGFSFAFLGCKENPNAETDLTRAIADVTMRSEQSIDKLVRICEAEDLISSCGLRLRSELTSSTSTAQKMAIARTLLKLSSKSHLGFVIGTLANGEKPYADIQHIAKNTLDESDSQRLVDLIQRSSGAEKRIAIRALTLVCGTEQVYELAISLLSTDQPRNERIESLILAGAAARSNQRPEAAQVLKPFLESCDFGVRLIAIYAIINVPGHDSTVRESRTLRSRRGRFRGPGSGCIRRSSGR